MSGEGDSFVHRLVRRVERPYRVPEGPAVDSFVRELSDAPARTVFRPPRAGRSRPGRVGYRIGFGTVLSLDEGFAHVELGWVPSGRVEYVDVPTDEFPDVQVGDIVSHAAWRERDGGPAKEWKVCRGLR